MMTARRRSWVWLWLSLALFVGAVLREAYDWASYDSRSPVEFQKAEALNSPVHPGEDLHVRVWRTKVRGDCPVVSSPYLSDVNGTLIELVHSFSVGGSTGTPYVDVTYDLPANLHTGVYILRDSLSYRCPNEVFNIPQPLIQFTVTN